jgi:hypothetical protein
MFSKLMKGITEGFGSLTDTDKLKHEEIRYYYGDKRPNAVFSGPDKNIPLASPTVTYMGSEIVTAAQANNRETPLNDKWLLPNNALSKDLMSSRQSACSSLGGAKDQFEHLTNLAANVDPKSRLRCGWVYNNANPLAGRAAYGTIDGPFDTSAQGTWMWNLQDAKKKLHIYICSGAKDCEDLSNDLYKGRCGFCKSSKKIIPINGGIAAYPYDGNYACASSNVISSADSCPKPPPPPPPGSPAAQAYQEARKPCDPLYGGRLPRDCLILKAKQVGCGDDGALVTALKGASDTNYLDTLKDAAAYTLYQQRAAVGLSETALNSGKMTVSDALNEFKNLYDSASSSANLGLQAAASDLCFTKGSLEEFDFCTEILPTTLGPFSLDCLQKAFKRAGGQETGSMYPSANTRQFWGGKNVWQDVLNEVEQMKSLTTSTDRGIQQDAIDKFYGIPLEDKSVPYLGNINNIEIFWFTPDSDLKNATSTFSTTFLGRRIRSQIPLLTGSAGLPGANKSGSFVYFGQVIVPNNVKLKMRYTGDSGFIFSRNQPMSNVYTGFAKDEKDKEFASYQATFGDPNSQVKTADSWTFTSNEVNIITGYYLGNGNNFRLEYIQDSNVPPECKCYGTPSSDNGRIRVYTEDECKRGLNGNWYSNGECIKAGGGSWSATCAGLNAQNPCANDWSMYPPNMLYLIQDPYAPMVSFEVRQNFQKYNCDYPLCDKRMGSHKMKWQIYGGMGPTPNYVGSSKDTTLFPLKKSFMQFRNGAGINSLFLMKMYSFMTMTFMIRFRTLPGVGVKASPIIFWASYPSMDTPSIFFTGLSPTTARVDVGGLWNIGTTNSTSAYGTITPPMTTSGPVIEVNQTYLITLNAIRSNEGDVKTLNALKVGAARVSDLQKKPDSMQYSQPLVWPNKNNLDDPNSTTAAFMLIKSDGGFIQRNWTVDFDLFHVQMYDYILDGENMKHAAKGDWAIMPPNIYT